MTQSCASRICRTPQPQTNRDSHANEAAHQNCLVKAPTSRPDRLYRVFPAKAHASLYSRFVFVEPARGLVCMSVQETATTEYQYHDDAQMVDLPYSFATPNLVRRTPHRAATSGHIRRSTRCTRTGSIGSRLPCSTRAHQGPIIIHSPTRRRNRTAPAPLLSLHSSRSQGLHHQASTTAIS